MTRLQLVDTDDDLRGVLADGVGIGIETTRAYIAEDVPSGSERTTMTVLKSLIGRSDIVRIWLTPHGSKHAVWQHRGVLSSLPDLTLFFDAEQPAELDDSQDLAAEDMAAAA